MAQHRGTGLSAHVSENDLGYNLLHESTQTNRQILGVVRLNFYIGLRFSATEDRIDLCDELRSSPWQRHSKSLEQGLAGLPKTEFDILLTCRCSLDRTAIFAIAEEFFVAFL